MGGIAIFDKEEEEQQSRNDPCIIVYLLRSHEEGLPGSSRQVVIHTPSSYLALNIYIEMVNG